MDARLLSHSHASSRVSTGSYHLRSVSFRRRRVAGRCMAEANTRDTAPRVLNRTSACLASTPELTTEKRGQPSIKTSLSVWHLLPILAAVPLLWPEASLAADEVLSPQLVDVFKSWLGAVQDLGPWGPLVFIATISLVECIPLFPTQPFTIGAGILFGATGGAACNLVGLCSASSIAFFLSRTVGQGLARKVISEETEGEPGGVQAKIADVTHAIENGSLLQQFGAIVLLRLTPVVPFSASNYVLGLTPVGYGVFIAGTGLGMTLWSTVYASLGAAARNLLTSGMDFSQVLAEVSEDAGEITEKVLVGALVLGVLVLALSRLPSPIPPPEDLGKPERPRARLDSPEVKVPADMAGKD